MMYVALLWRGFTSDGFPGGGGWGLEHECNASIKLVGGSMACQKTVSAAEMGRTGSGVEMRRSTGADISRIWLGTSFSSTQTLFYHRQVVFGCRPVETVGAPYAVVRNPAFTSRGD